KQKHAHHGGAWKVAYADFVTAMMAFFLVMWLVSQSSAVRGAVAGYFRDPGAFDHPQSTSMMTGDGPGVETSPRANPARGTGDAALDAERKALLDAADRIRKKLMQDTSLAELRDQIEITLTAEGLRIELVDRSGSSFFDSGSAVLLGTSEVV